MVQCFSYPFVLKPLKNWSLTVSIIWFIKITFSTANNQDSELVTLVYISLLQLHITFSVLLMLSLQWKFVAFSLIYLKHLIKFGIVVFFINSRVMELTVKSLNLLNSFLNNRCQRVALNDQSSVWKSVRAGVPQRSFLGPLVFLIYINDLPLGFTTNVKLFADDTSFISCKRR